MSGAVAQRGLEVAAARAGAQVSAHLEVAQRAAIAVRQRAPDDVTVHRAALFQ